MSYDAALRRDLTVNSMGFDPETQEILDPHNGRADLTSRTLGQPAALRRRPLRGLRAIQFAARLEMKATQELIELGAEPTSASCRKNGFALSSTNHRGARLAGTRAALSSRLNRHFPD